MQYTVLAFQHYEQEGENCIHNQVLLICCSNVSTQKTARQAVTIYQPSNIKTQHAAEQEMLLPLYKHHGNILCQNSYQQISY